MSAQSPGAMAMAMAAPSERYRILILWSAATATIQFVDQGAVTWMDGTGFFSGAVTAANSLYGGQANDHVGSGGVTALSNGHYVVSSPLWDNGAATTAGAVTWGNGDGSTVNIVVSTSNSLYGGLSGSSIGSGGVTALSNGN